MFRNSSSSEQYARMYTSAVDSAYENGIIHKVEVVPGSENENLTIFGHISFKIYFPILEHLACFAGGLLGMGAKLFDRGKDLVTAERVSKYFNSRYFRETNTRCLSSKFTSTCFWAYNSSETGLGPETMTFYHPLDYRRFSRHQDAGMYSSLHSLLPLLSTYVNKTLWNCRRKSIHDRPWQSSWSTEGR